MDEKTKKAINSFIKEKALLLMKHENKNIVQAGIPILNWQVFEKNGREFYVLPTNIFSSIIIEDKITDAVRLFPENFGSGNAKRVIAAIHSIEPSVHIDKYHEYLKREQFCYVVEVENGIVKDKILRIDLFREIKSDKGIGFDFIGGIFHCFKHFSFNDKPLSTGNEINNLSHPSELIYRVISAFFSNNDKGSSSGNFNSLIEYDKKYNLKASFYFEPITKVFFLNTAFKIKKETK